MPWWADLLVVLTMLIVTLPAAIKLKSSVPYGSIAILIALYLGVMTFTSMSPLWTIFLALMVATLYAIGLKKDDNNDDKWHFGALLLALVGKAILAAGPVAWNAVNGTQVPIWTWLLVGGVVALFFMSRSRRVKKKMSDTFSKTNKEPASAASN